MELTRDELIEGLRHCAHYGGCKDCPISGYCNGIEQMAIWCLPYVEGKENEPAPVSAGTSSEVSSDDTINSSHFNDTPVLEICQEKLENIQKSILDMYGGFSSKEQKAFDLGEIHRQIIDIYNVLEDELYSGNSKKGRD